MAITNNAAFKANFAAILKEAGDKVNLVVRKTALQLQTRMVQRSPVDTGRFKNNWTTGIGVVNTDTTTDTDLTGTGSIDRTVSAVSDWKPGQTINLTNSLPYAMRLEYDSWSKQAPSGMVRLTVLEFNQAVAEAAASIK